MLSSLHIRNYILIDSLDVEFPGGLVIISGRTGAGKSILLGALSLLTGAKADASLISSGADNCVVEAEFKTDDPEVKAIVEEGGAEWEGGNLLVRRVVHSSGRSRSFINDCPVQLSTLSDLSSRLVDIHGQHRTLALATPSFRQSILDLYAGCGPLLKDCAESWETLRGLSFRLKEIEGRRSSLEKDRDYNEARWSRLDEARLCEGELEELEAEWKILSNAEQIKEAFSSAAELLSPSAPEAASVSSSMREASRMLSKIASYSPGAEALATRLEEARIEIDDIIGETEAEAEKLEVSPQRLQQVEERMSELYSLLTKYDCKTVEELIAERDSLSSLLYDSTALDESIASLRESIEKERASYEKICKELRALRQKAAPELSSAIESELHFLELEKSIFTIELTQGEEGPAGADAVQFLFSSTGKNPIEASKCASGGELSRIMLCLKAVMARYTGMPTMIFDEIDSGVSGSAADKMGTKICAMGENMQVFAITHLPQVAAKGQAHFLVSKGQDDNSNIVKLSPEDRVTEIARMLSGSSITEEALANARRLLSE